MSGGNARIHKAVIGEASNMRGLPLLFRLDSGNDSIDTVKAIFNDTGVENRFLILKR